MMEYKITNKVNSLLRHFKGYEMNNVLLYTDMGQIVHVIKEFDSSKGWHKRVVSIAISDDNDPLKTFKATFESKEKLNTLIKMLQSYADEL